ncbi:MAG: YbhN family protein [Actinomycetes bacterium]
MTTGPSDPPEASSAAPDDSQPGSVPAEDSAPAEVGPERSRASRILFNRRVVKAVGILIVLGLLYYSFFVVLPSEVDWSEVWADIQALSLGQIVALAVAGLLAMVALGWASKASLPKLTLYQGFESSATSQLSAFAFPPPADMAIRFAMYRTYGFDDEQSAVAVLIAMVARYAVVVFMPLLGLAAVLVTGQGTWTGFWWFLGLGVAFALVMWLIIRVARSDAAAHATGRWLQRVVARVWHRVHRTPPDNLEDSIVKFGARTRGTIDANGRALIASNVAWGLANALIMAMAIRFSGLDWNTISPSAVLLTTGLTMAINMLPIPGKDALAVPWLAGILSLTSDADTSALGTALLLYRLVTWILPMPVGGVTFFAWRYRVRRDKVTTVDPSDDGAVVDTGSDEQG